MKKYDPKKIEKKWQKHWAIKKIYKTKDGGKKPKCFVLDMFPYPSGEGLHVGHPRGYIATDVYSRFKRMSGFNVLHPMGFDSFGLPAENYAIKNKIHPEVAIKNNIKRYKGQLEMLGFDYDWSREIITSDPRFYKWTQWMFLKMFEKGLAYESYEPINWCPSCKTGLANEDLDGDKCERCETKIEKKPMRQWVLKITDYAERLLEDLNELKDWPESIKESQRNWIGKSEGAEVSFKLIANSLQLGEIRIFTTRIDTIFGCTYLVVAPESKIIEELKGQIKNWEEVKKYTEEVKNKSDLQRTDLAKEKTGVELKGVKAINPVNGEELPVFVADYVLGGYGTGAVMAVPAHDERDFEFAKKYNLPVSNADLVDKEEAIKKANGNKKINYKLKDWVFSRQRYWGEPIPLIHCENCGVVAVPEKDLPVRLPKVKFYEPTDTGESPLAKMEKWVNVKCPKCGGKARRETNTMPQWAGSSWYYISYCIAENLKSQTLISKQIQNLKFKKTINNWLPVDMYVGGTEHATRHLIYARFWHKFLFDIGLVGSKEPFISLKNQGMIGGNDGRKMSKRWGNVVNPDDVVAQFGADTLRVYEMFMGPFDQPIVWSADNMAGSRRFLERVWGMQEKLKPKSKIRILKQIQNSKLEKLLHQTIKKVSEDIENFRFNTAISSLMILVNEMEKAENFSKETYCSLLILLSPFAPHITDELWFEIGGKKSVHLENWVKYDESKLESDEINIVVQINGKVRANFIASKKQNQKEIESLALSLPETKKWIGGNSIKKIFFIKDKVVSIVF